MTTKTRIRPTRVRTSTSPRSDAYRQRYTSPSRRQAIAAQPKEEASEQAWFIFMMAVALALGILFIGAISYVVILG